MSTKDGTNEEKKRSTLLGLRDNRTESNVAPVRIFNLPLNHFVRESKRQYRIKLWMYTWNGLCQVFIGAVNMAVLIYAILFQDTHAALCCLGQHFFIVQGILARNHYNGWSIAFRPKHSKLIHIILQIIGVITSFCGSIYIIVSKGFSTTVHGITGTIATIACLIAMLIGACAIYTRGTWTDIHKFFGVFTFSMTSVGLISGLLKSAFTHWAGYTITGIVIAFCVIYSIFIIWLGLRNTIFRIQLKNRLRDLSIKDSRY